MARKTRITPHLHHLILTLAADGLTATEVHRIVQQEAPTLSYAAVRLVIVKAGQTLTSPADRMRALHADPTFAAAHRERSRKTMQRLNADPEFRQRLIERARSLMQRLNADPVFKARLIERGRRMMQRLHADPTFAKANRKRMRDR